MTGDAGCGVPLPGSAAGSCQGGARHEGDGGRAAKRSAAVPRAGEPGDHLGGAPVRDPAVHAAPGTATEPGGQLAAPAGADFLTAVMARRADARS